MRTMRHVVTRALRSLPIAFLIAPTALIAAPGDESGEGGESLRARLTPVYEQLQTDPQFQAQLAQLNGHARDAAAVDRYLRFLPLSPLELLEIDMYQRRYEFIIPRFLRQWHKRWIELHEATARDHYGDAYVDGVLAQKLPLNGAEPDGAPTKMPMVGTNRNLAAIFAITPDDYQGEIQVAVDPNDPLRMVAAANTFDDANSTCAGDTQAIFTSGDGGVTWSYTCAPDDSAYAGISCPANSFLFGSDPALAWNRAGEVFLEYMLLCTPNGVSYQYSIVVSRSTDGGNTWAGQGIVVNSYPTPNVVQDKEFLSIDNHPQSPYYGRMYTCWDRNNDERMAYSTNGGTSWTTVNLPTTPSTGAGSAFDLACELAVQDDGTVHVIYDTLRCQANCNNEQMFYSRSTNGGLTWSAPVLVRDFNLVGFSGANNPIAQNLRGINPFGAIDVDNSGGPCDGTLYASFTDYRIGNVNNSDVWVSRSTNNGASWQNAVKVNDTPVGGNVQFHPFLVVDQDTGEVVVAWHDARNYDANQRLDFYVARSQSCGVSFQPNIQASAPSTAFNNSTISWSNFNSGANPQVNPNQTGEYLGLDAQGGKAYIAWTDTRHYFPSIFSAQRENVGFSEVDFGDYVLASPKPGLSGANATWTVSNATNGQTTFFLFGTVPGSIAVPGCPGVTVGIQNLAILGQSVAAGGTASTSLFVPAGVSGQTFLFQAIELNTCTVSNLLTYTFP